ncbi:peptidase A24 [Streptococcus agalactiae LMG 14747]|uniref:Peptidase A24 n=3 Tax=Streptococcus TaxID=1301 RepID=V6Z316_STRAG|nr:peptidase A24 [Streptococcus agalactiae LMG 14747]SNV44371.1 Type II secretory pathway, prepilin signal peptidase PulO and related peptidases [Streptococcus acidominimus]
MTILIFLTGTTVGSFIGLVLDRFPEQSIISPASHCTSCQTRLRWFDLFPIVSQLSSKSRCRYCQTKLPIRYALIEACYGLIALFSFWQILTLSQAILLATSLCLSLYDIKSHSFPLMIWLLVFIPMAILNRFQIITVFLLLLGIWADIKNIGVGSGDFLYLALLSLSINFQDILWIIQIASFLGILVLAIKKDRELAFVPYLSLAYVLILICHHASL